MLQPASPAPADPAPASRAPASLPAAVDDGWPRWYRPLIAIGLAGSMLVSIGAFATASAAGADLDAALVYLIVPAAIVLSVGASRRAGPAFAVLAAVLLDVEAMLTAARAAAGLAFAVILPFGGLVLVVSSRHGRSQWLAFVAAGAASTIAIAIGFTIGPVSRLPGLASVWLAVIACGVFITFVLTHLALLTDMRTRAMDAATAELESRRAAEAELDRTSRLLSAIVDASPVPTQAFTPDGTVVLWNAASERVFGWTGAEVVGRRMPPEMTPDEERAAGADRIRRTLDGAVMNGVRTRRRSRDGRDVWVDIYGARMVDADGRTIGLAGQLVDVTERVALEDQLRQSAKMDAIGQLSGGIAHDFNNMLTAIRGYAELVRAGLTPEQASLRADVDQILQASDRAGNLTRQLLAFARKTVVEPRVLDPATVVTHFAPMLRRLLGEHIELVLGLAPDTGMVRVDPVQLEQVILNLALNARDAMPDGGTLRISTANEGPDPGSPVVLTVADTGCGMDEATRARIFEPFFTTKAPGQGTGMGLATVFGIVSMFDGSIHVASEVDRGTTFSICLPRARSEPEQVSARTADALPGGSETILLVEDEPAVRAFASRSLAALGYSVLEAAGDTDALAIARGHPGPIHLVVSDVVLPGTPGPVLVRQLLGIRPGARTVLCSGYPGDAGVDADAIRPGVFLPKPFTRDSLGRAVRAALDAPA